MSKPQVIVVPAGAGTGAIPPVQIPLLGVNITLVNLNSSLGLSLCNDSQFNATTTWPLLPSMALPQTGINNLWAQNSNTSEVQVLVLEGIIPVTFGIIYPPTINVVPSIVGSQLVYTTAVDTTNTITLPNPSQCTLDITFNVVSSTLDGQSETITITGNNSGHTYYSAGMVAGSVTTRINAIYANDTELIVTYSGIFNTGQVTAATNYYFSIPPVSPSTTSLVLNYQIVSSTVGAVASLKDVAGSLITTIDLSQAIGTYTLSPNTKQMALGSQVYGPYIVTTTGSAQSTWSIIGLSGQG